MEIFNIPEALCLPIRIKLLSCLLDGEKTFSSLKEITNASDGNISVQLTKLEEWGFVESKKEICKKRPKTTYSITEYGVGQFEEYVNLLESIIKNKG